MKAILNKLFEQQRLTKEEAKAILIEIAAEKFNNSQIASFFNCIFNASNCC